MVDSEVRGGLAASPRRRQSAEERRLIVHETLEAGSSVARVARKYGINANQVFMWRRLYRSGHLAGEFAGGLKLLPVTVSDDASSLIVRLPIAPPGLRERFISSFRSERGSAWNAASILRSCVWFLRGLLS